MVLLDMGPLLGCSVPLRSTRLPPNILSPSYHVRGRACSGGAEREREGIGEE